MPRPRWSLIVFVVVALGCGWLGVALNKAAGTPSGQEGPGLTFWLVAPLLTVVVLRLVTGGWKLAGLRPRFTRLWRWYLVAAAIPLAVSGTVLASAAALGVVTWGDSWTAWATGGAIFLGFNVIKNVFEEFAWRGYLTAELTARGWADLPLHLAVALVWGLWHLPYYHGLLDPADTAAVLPLRGVAFGLWACLAIGAMSVVLVELFRISGSIWPPLLMHTVHNSFVDTLQVRGHVTLDRAATWWLSPVVGLASAALYLAVGLGLRRWRIAHQPA